MFPVCSDKNLAAIRVSPCTVFGVRVFRDTRLLGESPGRRMCVAPGPLDNGWHCFLRAWTLHGSKPAALPKACVQGRRGVFKGEIGSPGSRGHHLPRPEVRASVCGGIRLLRAGARPWKSLDSAAPGVTRDASRLSRPLAARTAPADKAEGEMLAVIWTSSPGRFITPGPELAIRGGRRGGTQLTTLNAAGAARGGPASVSLWLHPGFLWL